MNTRQMHKGAVIAISTLALATLTACGSNSQPENVSATANPAAAPTSATMSTPSNDVTPTTSQAAPQEQSSTSDAPVNSTPERQLPTSAGDYSEAFMQAWTGGDKDAMANYAAANVVDEMTAVTPKGALLRTVCEDNMCSYSEENGGRVTLTLDLAKVDSGATKAITAVKLDL